VRHDLSELDFALGSCCQGVSVLPPR